MFAGGCLSFGGNVVFLADLWGESAQKCHFATGDRSNAWFCEGETYGFTLALPFPFRIAFWALSGGRCVGACYHDAPCLVFARKCTDHWDAEGAWIGFY